MKPISWFSITWQLASTYRKLYWQSIKTDHPSFIKAVFFSLARFYIIPTLHTFWSAIPTFLMFLFSVLVYICQFPIATNNSYAFNISLVPNKGSKTPPLLQLPVFFLLLNCWRRFGGPSFAVGCSPRGTGSMNIKAKKFFIQRVGKHFHKIFHYQEFLLYSMF